MIKLVLAIVGGVLFGVPFVVSGYEFIVNPDAIVPAGVWVPLTVSMFLGLGMVCTAIWLDIRGWQS